MDDLKKDENIIELTDVVEEAPGPAAGRWMETAPPPAPEKKAPEPAGAKKEAAFHSPADLKGIPDSPLKKFILAEEEPPAPVNPGEGKPPGPPSAAPRAPLPFQQGTRSGGGLSEMPPERPRPVSPEPPRAVPEPPRPPEPPRVAAPGPRPAPEPDRPSLPGGEAEMRAMREAMLARVEKWCSQEGAGILDRLAREMFPGIAERIIRQEIDRMKAKAEEKE
jgi:hypothetical protein